MLIAVLGWIAALGEVIGGAPMGTAFTYQGRLIDANNAADGLYDFQFKLFDANVAGSQKGSTISISEVDVIDGYFTVLLDFGSDVFTGNACWLEIGVRLGNLKDPNTYTTLSPRQEITPTPYALQTRGIFVDNAGNVGIGTTGPGAKLHVLGGRVLVDNSDGFHVRGQGTNNCARIWYQTDNAVQWNVGARNDTGQGGGFSFENNQSGWASKLFITTTGNVGIGTTSPDAKLEVAGQVKITGGSPAAGKVLTSDGKGLATWQTPFTGDSDWIISGSNMYSGVSGNVGIGTISPAAKLEVAGQVKITGGSPAAGKVLTSDVTGLATWQTPFTGDSDWIISGSNMYSGVSGNVGIGTAEPTEKLIVTGSINSNNQTSGGFNSGGTRVFMDLVSAAKIGRIGTLAGGDSLSGTQGELGLYVKGCEYVRINAAGNVGIGTSSPSAKLEVNGDISSVSAYKIGDDTVLSASVFNTLVGRGAGYSNTTGQQNTFSGYGAGLSNTTGNDNTFSGFQAGCFNTTGYGNTFSGLLAGYKNTTGYNNTFSGYMAGRSNTEGWGNIFSGWQAGYSNTTGSGNIFSGYRAGFSNQTGNSNVFIGYGAGYYETGSNKLYIANSSFDPNVLIYGEFSTWFPRVGIGTTSPTETLDVRGTVRVRGISAGSGTMVVADGNGKLWKSSSSQRYKTNIEQIDADTDAVLKLRPVSFQWKTTGQNDIGLIAEEVEQQLNDLVIYDNEGRPEAVKYDKVSLYLLAVVKDLKAENESLKQRLTSLETTVEQLTRGKEF
jgi:hypothetical protein